MKNLIIAMFLLIGSYSFSQLSIGKEDVTNSSISLEFGTQNRGIVLPWVTSFNDIPAAVDGTFIYDISDKKVKYKSNGLWYDLSIDTTGVVDTTLQDNLTESAEARLVIGVDANTDQTPGILVLSDNDKAMVLPKVASPHVNIISPAAGMMAYDTTSRQLAVFNGTVWTFWKPDS